MERNTTVATVANVLQLTYDVLADAHGNAFDFPESRKGNEQLILQDIGEALVRKLKADKGVA